MIATTTPNISTISNNMHSLLPYFFDSSCA